MMPVIRIPDSVYERLQRHATPFVDTPATVIEKLLDAYETKQLPRGLGGQPSALPPKAVATTTTDISGLFTTEDELPTDQTEPPKLLTTDVYVNYGHGDNWREWNDARQYGFLCAGGGRVYSDPLRRLQPTDRLWVYVPGDGYVGVGQVTGSVRRAAEFSVRTPQGELRPITEVLGDGYANDDEYRDDPEMCEYFVPVQWFETKSLDDAVWESDMFANQAIVCRPKSGRWRRTLARLKSAFPNHDPEA